MEHLKKSCDDQKIEKKPHEKAYLGLISDNQKKFQKKFHFWKITYLVLDY